MKKFRIVGLLLVLCLISSSFVGVTFAKYTSTATGSDNAVVAKWSFTVDDKDIAVNDSFQFDLFSTVQELDAGSGIPTGVNDDDVDDAVMDADTAQIIAPGTGGSFVLNIKNDSQVTANYKISFTVDNTNIPIEYQINGGAWTSSIADINIDANISSAGTASYTILWRWVYEGGDDGKDTNLGINPESVTVTASAIATQVD